MVWFDGPMAIDDSVGFTKKPVHPDATMRSSTARTAAASEYFCPEVRIISETPRQSVM